MNDNENTIATLGNNNESNKKKLLNWLIDCGTGITDLISEVDFANAFHLLFIALLKYALLLLCS
jgi:hypothetical protein